MVQNHPPSEHLNVHGLFSPSIVLTIYYYTSIGSLRCAVCGWEHTTGVSDDLILWPPFWVTFWTTFLMSFYDHFFVSFLGSLFGPSFWVILWSPFWIISHYKPIIPKFGGFKEGFPCKTVYRTYMPQYAPNLGVSTRAPRVSVFDPLFGSCFGPSFWVIILTSFYDHLFDHHFGVHLSTHHRSSHPWSTSWYTD